MPTPLNEARLSVVTAALRAGNKIKAIPWAARPCHLRPRWHHFLLHPTYTCHPPTYREPAGTH